MYDPVTATEFEDVKIQEENGKYGISCLRTFSKITGSDFDYETWESETHWDHTQGRIWIVMPRYESIKLLEKTGPGDGSGDYVVGNNGKFGLYHLRVINAGPFAGENAEIVLPEKYDSQEKLEQAFRQKERPEKRQKERQNARFDPKLKKAQTLTSTSFALGLSGLLTSWLLVGILLCIPGLILGILGMRQTAFRGKAIAGLVLSIIGIAVVVTITVLANLPK